MPTDNLLSLDPLAAAIEDYLLAVASQGRASKTLEIYRIALTSFAKHAGPLDPARLTPAVLRAWLAALAAAGKSATTQADYLRATKTFVGWLADEGAYGLSQQQQQQCRDRVKSPTVPDDGVDPLDDAAIALLLKGCNVRSGWLGVRMRAMLALLLDTGVRASELCGLTIADVDLGGGEIHVRAETSKTRRGRTIALGRRANREMGQWWARKRHLWDASPESPWFCTRDERPLRVNALYYLLVRHGDRCGVPNCHPHRFRHTAAIMALRGGMGEIAVMRMLGHTTLAMTRRYVAYLDSDVSVEKRRAAWLDKVRM